MKNLKSLKEFQEEGLTLSAAQQSTIVGGVAQTSKLSPTSGGSQGDCTRYAKEDNPNLQDADNSSFEGVVLAGVTAANCHF